MLQDVQARVEAFAQHLKDNGLSWHTQEFYCQSIRKYLFTYEDTRENAIEFVRKHRSPRHKFALVAYLRWQNRQEDVLYLPKAKRPPKKSSYALPNQELIRELIMSIPDEKYRIVALIQYDSGRRAHEIIRLKRDNITVDSDGDLLFYTIRKGNREDRFYVSKATEQLVIDYLKKTYQDYPFMKDYVNPKIRQIQRSIFDVWLKMTCKHYFLTLKKVRLGSECANFTSHDFRRNFIRQAELLGAEKLRQGSISISPVEYAQKLVGHANITTTLKYIHREPLDLKDAIRSLRG